MTGRPSRARDAQPGVSDVTLLGAGASTGNALTILAHLSSQPSQRILGAVLRGDRLTLFDAEFFDDLVAGAESEAHADARIGAAMAAAAEDACADVVFLGVPALLNGARSVLWTTETRDGAVVHWLLALDDVTDSGGLVAHAGEMLHVDPHGTAAAHFPVIGRHVRQVAEA